MNIFFEILGDLFDGLVDSLNKPKGFNAAFADETEIASRFNKGLLISCNRRLRRRLSFSNLLIAGPTGSGKTTRLLLKNLFVLKNCSIVVNDPSKELYQLASGYLSQYFDIKTLNFSDSSISSGYNILSRIKRPNDINKIAHMLIAATLDKGSNADPFWSLQSKALLVLFIKLILYQSKEQQHMANVLYALNCFAAEPKKVDQWIVATGDKKLWLEYKTFVSTPEKTLMNIVASAKAALQLFDDAEIAKVTSHDSISFESLREKPTIIFLHNSVSSMKYVNTLNGIFFEQLYGHILQNLPQDHEHDLFIILEEASSIYVSILATAIANTRKHRCGNIICVQSPGQLKTLYRDEADNVQNNCTTKIFLPGITSMDTLRELETLSGKMVYVDDHKTERVKQLLTIDEIRLLPENKSLIVSGNKPFILGRTSPYFKSWKFKRRSQIPPIPLQGDIPDSPLQFIGE